MLDESDNAGHFEGRDIISTKLDDFLLPAMCAFREFNKRRGDLSKPVMGRTDYLSHFYGGMSEQ